MTKYQVTPMRRPPQPVTIGEMVMAKGGVTCTACGSKLAAISQLVNHRCR